MAAEQEVLNTTEARQATPQRMSYRVLTHSLIIAVVLAAVAFVYFYMLSPA